MPMPKKLSSYESEWFLYVERAFRDPLGLLLTCTDSAKARWLQLRFYGFREALRSEAHPHLIFADGLTAKVRAHELLLTRATNASEAIVHVRSLSSGQEINTSPTFNYEPTGDNPPLELIQPLQPTEDPMESALRKLGFFAAVKDDKPKDPK